MSSVPTPVIKRHFHIKISPVIAAFLSLAGAFLLTMTPLNNIWTKNTYNIHLAMESICVFISIGIFIVVWFTYGESAPYVNPVCLGFLVVAVLDIFHIYYFTPIGSGSNGYNELSQSIGFLGRLTEAIILLLIVYYPRKNQVKKTYMFFLTVIVLLLAFIFISFIIYPVLHETVWLIIILIHLTTMISAIIRKATDSIILNTSLLTFLILSIASLTIFISTSRYDQVASLYAHMVRVASFCFLFSAIIVTYIAQPLKKMSETTEFLNAILNMLPEGVIHYDKNGNVSFINKKTKEIFKIDNMELLEQSLQDFADKSDQTDEDNNDFIDIQTESYGSNVLTSYMDAEGNSLKLITRAKQVNNGTIVLLNEAKTHQRLRNMELQTKTILDSINSLVLMCDSKGKIVLCNKKLKETMNITDYDIKGTNIRDFWSKLLSKHVVDVKNKANTPEGFAEIIFASGDVKRTLLYQKASIHDIDGENVGTIIVGSDITEIREQEDVIIQQEKLALLGQMGASIVHETKNFLTTIKGGSQLLELIAEDDRVKKIAKKIDNATDEVNKIICGFLLLSRPKSSVFKETSVNELLESILPLLETSTFMSDIKISLTLCSNECRVLTDESQIKQVIMNIAKNGVEAMSGLEEQILKIETKFLEESNEMTITIEDMGAGVPEGILEELGKPFFTTKEKGTGLGLSVSYRIIHEHGGRIDIDSKVGKGAKFIITLPCIDEKKS